MTAPHPHSTRLLHALRQLGAVATSAQLASALGLSQSSISRALAPLLQAGLVCKVGAARSQRYLLLRAVRGLAAQIPLWRIDTQGRPAPFARLWPLASGAFWAEEADGLRERHDGLPWFLADMRPQGFMGRHFAQQHADLQLPPDPRDWSDDDMLRALALRGEDQPGNLVVGAASLARFHALAPQMVQVDSADAYPALAQGALQGALPGSSAGGEQPKFCCLTGGRSVIVKFSSAAPEPSAQRVRDLLYCEHLALHTLAAAGLPAARTRVLARGGRVFLESERFDRAQPWAAQAQAAPGRIGMVSLQVYDAQYIGAADNWAATAQRMAAHQPPLLTPQDARTLRLLEAYGRLIGNTDRHYGNISLVLDGDDWRLSPTYDMLPMRYMPIAGELLAQEWCAAQEQPTAATQDLWPQALALAQTFWQAAAQQRLISAPFRRLARAQAAALAGAHPHTPPPAPA